MDEDPRSIPCKDNVGRDRALQVWGAPGHLTFVAPPGEVAYVHPRHWEQLRRALQDALTEAYKEPERRPAADGPMAEPRPTGGSAGAEVESAANAVPGGSALGPHQEPRRADPC